MGRPDDIFGQFRETARCRDAQHGCGVCCAFAPHSPPKGGVRRKGPLNSPCPYSPRYTVVKSRFRIFQLELASTNH